MKEDLGNAVSGKGLIISTTTTTTKKECFTWRTDQQLVLIGFPDSVKSAPLSHAKLLGGPWTCPGVEKAPSTTNKSAIAQVSQSMTSQHFNPRKGMISARAC